MSNQQNIEQFFKAFTQRVQQVQQQLPGIIGTEVVNSALDNFKKESFEDNKWPARKDKNNNRKLLIKSGTLRRSISILSQGQSRVTVGSTLPYAAVHNYGGTINRAARSETFTRNRHKRGVKKGLFRRGTVQQQQGFTFKAYSYSMPKRQFLGATPKLKQHLENVIREELTKAFK